MKAITRFLFFVGIATCATGLRAEDFAKPPITSEIKLLYGSNDVPTNEGSLRIIKAAVGTSTAHGYETYTSFLLPKSSAEAWQQVLVDQPDQDFPSFRTEESADSSIQAIGIYRGLNGNIFVVQATKEGLSSPELYLKASHVVFKVFRFNENTDVARFKQVAKFQTEATYIDANYAIVKEFFRK
ncbi:hypothetical protein [Burkholderia sp. SRS-W-2-2016]|uniref:hypothetical protein n=1 Tax=Burkholderia sp. SRS-W-2-2016 TaxID=1926878 RepID=UPI00117BEDE1|nr:hypothetical protein [Burkholderia sp. SRS-W-2-2016]